MSPPSKKQKVLPAIPAQVFTSDSTVGVVLAPFSGGQPKGGVEKGPGQLIGNGIVGQLQGLGWTVTGHDQQVDLEALRPAKEVPHRIVKNMGFVSAVTRKLQQEVKRVVDRKHIALTLGGDHSIGISTVSASASCHPSLGVIWVDAHADINTPDSTDSGNLHGMPVSLLMGLGSKLEAFGWLNPCLKPSRIVYVGLRDVDAGEKRILKENGIKAFSMHEVDKYGIGKVMDMAFAHLGHDCPLHLSFDVDALDPSVAGDEFLKNKRKLHQ